MTTPTLLLGRMRMREDRTVAETGGDDGARGLTLTGQESIPRLSLAAIARQREDFLTMSGQLIPVSFETKTYLDGFYTVQSVSGTIEDWGDDIGVFRWNAVLTRAGTESDTDMESRLSGSVTRVNDFSVTGERSHAPAIVHSGYWTDATVTQVVTRIGEDGAVKLYRGIGAAVSPRWSTTPSGYLTGRVRFTDELGRERAGDGARLPAAGWVLSNGLVRVQPLVSGGVLEVAAYTGGAWRAKAWDVLKDAVSLGTFDSCMILDNQLEMVSLRLMKSQTFGRVFLDITLRRGHRFAELYLQSEFGGTLKIMRSTTEAGLTTVNGTVVASANDADGNKYIVGSARSFTADLNGGISKAAAPALDAYVGVVAAGTGAVAGDTAADLQKQYMGLPSETVQAVRR